MSSRELRDSGSPLKILGENVTMVLDRMDFICSIANNLEDICEKISPQLLLVKFSLKECKAVIDNCLSEGENPKLLKIKEEDKTLGDDYDDFLDHGVFGADGADMDTLYPEDEEYETPRRKTRKYKVKKEKKPKKTSESAKNFISFMKHKQNTDEVDYELSDVASAIATRDFSCFIMTPETDESQETDKDEIVIPKSETAIENDKNIIKTERGDDQEKFIPSSNGQENNMENRDNNGMQSEGQRSHEMNYGQDQALNYADEQAVNYAMFRDNQGENMGDNGMMRDGQMESRDHMLRDGESMMQGSNESMDTGVQGVEKVNTMLDDGSGELKETKVKVYEPVLLCKLCEFSSPNKENLLIHLEDTHFSKSSECPHCHIKLMEFEVEPHVKSKHSNNCKYCQQPFPADELKAHQKACLHEKGVLCLVCGKIFEDRKKLRCHMTTHTMGPRVECDICHKMYKSEKVLDHHKRVAHTGKTFKCEECDKEFDRQDYLKKHKMHVHMNNQSMACQDCGKVFPSELKLNRHMAVHTIPATIPCDICNRLYREQKDLNHHKKIIHSDNVETCYICGANYKTKSNLKKHIKTHLGIKDCTCDLCGKPFSNTTTLKKHVEQFHSVRNMFSCHLCEKTFKYKDTLNYHLKVHSGYVEHCTCEECGKSFTMKNNLKKHMRKVHKIFQKKPILLLDIKNHQGMQGIPGVPK